MMPCGYIHPLFTKSLKPEALEVSTVFWSTLWGVILSNTKHHPLLPRLIYSTYELKGSPQFFSGPQGSPEKVLQSHTQEHSSGTQRESSIGHATILQVSCFRMMAIQ